MATNFHSTARYGEGQPAIQLEQVLLDNMRRHLRPGRVSAQQGHGGTRVTSRVKISMKKMGKWLHTFTQPRMIWEVERNGQWSSNHQYEKDEMATNFHST